MNEEIIQCDEPVESETLTSVYAELNHGIEHKEFALADLNEIL